MGKRSRVKGYRGEHEVERLFRERGFDARRVPLSGASVFQKGDVVVFVDGQPRWVVEVKRRKKGFVELYRWLEEADIVFHRADRSPWLVTMDVQTFWELERFSDAELIAELERRGYKIIKEEKL